MKFFTKKKSPETKHPVLKKRQKWSRLTGDSGEKEYFIDNLSMLLSSGMDILAALDAIQEGVRTKTMKGVIDTLKDDVSDGRPLWKSLEDTKLLSLHILSLFRIGEESGQLSENLKVINIQQQKERTFKSKINSAMMYPVLVLSLTLVVGIGIAWFILPRLSVVFLQLKMDLPFVTKALIALGNFLGQYGIMVIPAFLFVLFLFFYFIFIYKKTKWIGQWFLFHFPVIKKVIQEIELSRFGYILGNLLDAGIPIVESLHSLSEATTFQVYSEFYTYLEDSINQGNTFRKSFASYPGIKSLMPATVQQMVSSGEQSGNLSNMLARIGVTFEEKTETSTKNLSVMLEPILLLVVWGGVIMVALAVILPIYTLVGGLNDPKDMSTPPPTAVVQTAPGSETTNPEIVAQLPILEIVQDVDSLNVRTEPYGSIIQKVLPGETYSYTDQRDDWYEIELEDDKRGWVSGDYVTLQNYASAPKIEEQTEILSPIKEGETWAEILPTGIGYLNVRANPSDVVIGKAYPGKRYQYITEQNGWYQIVLTENQNGWVSGRYIKPLPNE